MAAAFQARAEALRAKVDRNKAYPLDEALTLVKETATAKFDESIDVAVNLGIDAKKSDQMVRGSVVLPRRYRQDGARRGVRAGRQGRGGQGGRRRHRRLRRPGRRRSRAATWISTS